ncbi:ankyrin repeat family protein [Actinidia rufa]|uniref:Ankyrin repeat family protein n=1 Tax=Actinidia rufa TaxID=165716 RepID=A0A7J0G7L8_9ERIC|nr:ankyrin repeat family protein [Actinidia rufa]
MTPPPYQIALAEASPSPSPSSAAAPASGLVETPGNGGSAGKKKVHSGDIDTQIGGTAYAVPDFDAEVAEIRRVW